MLKKYCEEREWIEIGNMEGTHIECSRKLGHKGKHAYYF